MLRVLRNRRRFLGALCVLGLAAGVAVLHAQRRFEFYLLAFDNEGYPVVDLKPADLQFKEGEVLGNVVSVEPYRWPVKVSVLVDNGTGGASGVGGAGRTDSNSFDNVGQYRAGLKKFLEAIGKDIEISIVATAPTPRHLIRASMDPIQLEKAVNSLVPDHEVPGRFTDGLTEYAERLDAEFKGLTREQRPPYLPILVVIGSTGLDGSRVEIPRVTKMINSLRNYGVQTHFIMVSPSSNSANIENEGGPVLIAHAVQNATNGRYDPINSSSTSRLSTLLPEIGRSIQVRHVKQTMQYKVVLERPDSATGPAQPPSISVSRPNVKYILSLDGSYP